MAFEKARDYDMLSLATRKPSEDFSGGLEALSHTVLLCRWLPSNGFGNSLPVQTPWQACRIYLEGRMGKKGGKSPEFCISPYALASVFKALWKPNEHPSLVQPQ